MKLLYNLAVLSTLFFTSSFTNANISKCFCSNGFTLPDNQCPTKNQHICNSCKPNAKLVQYTGPNVVQEDYSVASDSNLCVEDVCQRLTPNCMTCDSSDPKICKLCQGNLELRVFSRGSACVAVDPSDLEIVDNTKTLVIESCDIGYELVNNVCVKSKVDNKFCAKGFKLVNGACLEEEESVITVVEAPTAVVKNDEIEVDAEGIEVDAEETTVVDAETEKVTTVTAVEEMTVEETSQEESTSSGMKISGSAMMIVVPFFLRN